ncbi:Glycosyl transferase family 2 [Poseidonocella pacifica]|uniref:Glycosyl transferase family 2 n=1 Tax=Poseidonocella pacifica TaxID=871651 RepID=A0A1I0YS35_9RHOB|nr:glycosyltransferase family 2 protein [Poseidonocella pacifica]SFB16189.1 Glycosyl transferase family 2 [Poseidonocella pacifica]
MKTTTLFPEAVSAARVAIIIPARDEADRISACLSALAAQREAPPFAVHICVNNSTDETARMALRHPAGLPCTVTEVDLPCGGVGRARRLGHLIALRRSPRARVLLSTDADCEPDPVWVAGMTRALRRRDAVAGGIEGLSDLPQAHLERLRHGGEIEREYLTLSMEIVRLMCGGRALRALLINTAGGANLGFQRAAYREVGGFRAMDCQEDRDIIDRSVAMGLRVGRAPDAIVRASMRLTGRAPRGMAAVLTARLSGQPDALDSALEPLDQLLLRQLGETARSMQPLSIPSAESELPRLRGCVQTMRSLRSVQERHCFARQVLNHDRAHVDAWFRAPTAQATTS